MEERSYFESGTHASGVLMQVKQHAGGLRTRKVSSTPEACVPLYDRKS